MSMASVWRLRRYLHPWYLLQAGIIAFFWLHTHDVLLQRGSRVLQSDITGMSRQYQVWFSLAAIGMAKSLSLPTWDAVVAEFLFLGRVAVILMLGFAEAWDILVWYVLAMLVLWISISQPVFRDANSQIQWWNATQWAQRDAGSEHVTYFYATWHPPSVRTLPLFSQCADQCPERSDSETPITFSQVDIGRAPGLAKSLGIDLSPSTADANLPCIIRFPPSATSISTAEKSSSKTAKRAEKRKQTSKTSADESEGTVAVQRSWRGVRGISVKGVLRTLELVEEKGKKGKGESEKKKSK